MNESTPSAAGGTPYVARTRKQVQAAEMATQAAILSRWKGLLADAHTTWPKLPSEELAQVRGNLNKLAGMVQLRYQLNREEADLQVKSFMDRHPVA